MRRGRVPRRIRATTKEGAMHMSQGLFLLLCLGVGGVASAEEAGPTGRPGVAGIGQPIEAAALDQLRGGDDRVVENDIRVDGEVVGNSADHVTSGANIIDGGAFGNAAGVPTVIQNSGSNVLIQNAMIVNVQFGPPGS
jgi:hypothetical protein